jgi:HYR domain
VAVVLPIECGLPVVGCLDAEAIDVDGHDERVVLGWSLRGLSVPCVHVLSNADPRTKRSFERRLLAHLALGRLSCRLAWLNAAGHYMPVIAVLRYSMDEKDLPPGSSRNEDGYFVPGAHGRSVCAVSSTEGVPGAPPAACGRPLSRTLATVLSHTRPYTVVGGTGAYSGATGAGTVRRVAGFAGQRAVGTDFVVGTFTVPSLEFDLTPPRLTGASSRTVRAAKGATRARVIYQVAARDAIDGRVSVKCTPPSGSRFRIGHTLVRCSATDLSGNTARTTFGVSVRRAK